MLKPVSIIAMLAAMSANAQVVPVEAVQTAELSATNKALAVPALMATQPNVIADLAAAVSPAVVNIRVSTPQGEVVSEGHGSGFVISTKGEVVTNHHVIDEGEIIDIEFNNGVTFGASIIGTDPETDIALLQIDSDQTFPTTRWHDASPLRIGEFVVPIGNPFGIGQSVSFGIISAIGRDRVDSGAYVDYIQTDATVNTGNSGGPLFDLEGRVVGVNSAIYSPTGASVGIAFAIPHKTAEAVVERLRADGEVRRGYLGAGLRTGAYSDGRSGAIVDSTVPGGPAQLAGLQVDDIILNIDGRMVTTGTEAVRRIANVQPGKTVRLRIERSEREMDLDVMLTERPSKDSLEGRVASEPVNTTPPPPLGTGGSGAYGVGLSLVDISSQFRKAIGMGYDEVGVYLEAAVAGSGADRSGFETGMVLMEIDTQPTPSVEEFNRLIRRARESGKSEVVVQVRLKAGGTTFYPLPIV